MSRLPIGDFLEERLKEYDSTFEVRVGSGFERLFFRPMQFIMQPLRDEVVCVPYDLNVKECICFVLKSS